MTTIKCCNCNKLIKGEIFICDRCEKVAYCGLKCQKLNQTVHKYSCVDRLAADKWSHIPTILLFNKYCSRCGKTDTKLKKCGLCMITHYCDQVCQKEDWSLHKKICKEELSSYKILDSLANTLINGGISYINIYDVSIINLKDCKKFVEGYGTSKFDHLSDNITKLIGKSKNNILSNGSILSEHIKYKDKIEELLDVNIEEILISKWKENISTFNISQKVKNIKVSPSYIKYKDILVYIKDGKIESNDYTQIDIDTSILELNKLNISIFDDVMEYIDNNKNNDINIQVLILKEYYFEIHYIVDRTTNIKFIRCMRV